MMVTTWVADLGSGSGAGAPAGCGAEPREENFGLQPPKKTPKYIKVERNLTPTLQPCCWHNYNAALPCLLVLAHAAGAAHPLLLRACPRSASQRILHTRSARSCCPTHANVHGVRLPHHCPRLPQAMYCDLRAQRAFRKMGGPL